MLDLRQFQTDLKHELYKSWDEGNKNTLLVAPTGAGKTVIMSSIAVDVQAPTVAIAHRQELVQQIAMANMRMDTPMRIIAAEKTIKTIIQQQIEECGMSYVDQTSHVSVAGIDTLNRQSDSLRQWANTVKYWEGDEAHHFLASNKWGKGVTLFPNAKGVGFTASPVRCDKKSLHADQGGVFNDMRVGPSPRELINMGYLCDYRIFGPPQSINDADLTIGASGDYTGNSMRSASEKSTITGDVVKHYLLVCALMDYGNGCKISDLAWHGDSISFPNGARRQITDLTHTFKQGITFTVDVESAERIANEYQRMGVSAAAVSAKTPDTIRNALIKKFRQGQIKQLVNVDLFGEGFDVPNVEIVSMGRPTQSFGLYLQQFGRALRILKDKLFGIIIDHVGNVKRHGLPDADRRWTLWAEQSGRGQTRDPNVMPVTTCTECFMSFEAVTKTCPFCGHVAEPENRGEPQFVDGDLVEFSPELLASLRAEAAKIDSDFVPVPQNLRGTPAEAALNRKHGEAQQAQAHLRETIALWAGIRRDMGMGDSEIYRRFYHSFGVDIATAQGLRTNDATKLTLQVQEGYWT